MKIHFIAIGGAAMHSLAIAMHEAGHLITGSDDEIFDPARTKLAVSGLLPKAYGWFPEKVTSETEIVILGMHAQKNNPELLKALELGIKVYSYPEFLFNRTKGKTRVVIAGSHGKTTITSMVMHVLKHTGKRFDYMAGAKLEGFDNMVSLSPDTNIAIFEGDEYLSSCLDPRPKFHVYQPQIALVSGIAWDHINVFPTWENYISQFRIFIENIPSGGCLIFCSEDTELNKFAATCNPTIKVIPYGTPFYKVEQGKNICIDEDIKYEMLVFGRHNMQNMEGARLICNQLGISNRLFFEAIVNFGGAGKRLQLLGQKNNRAVYLDFAHSPSKVEATVNAVREQFPGSKLTACLELHTFSSLNKNFLAHYIHTMDKADRALVYYSPETIVHKQLEMISTEEIKHAFGNKALLVFTKRNELEHYLRENSREAEILLLMSSGNFSGIDFKTFTTEILSQ
jgi:UDP-N-acetylmuramate: L-alanyl-gamma-D-glutamyl-meso-diaminopimelate ligase